MFTPSTRFANAAIDSLSSSAVSFRDGKKRTRDAMPYRTPEQVPDDAHSNKDAYERIGKIQVIVIIVSEPLGKEIPDKMHGVFDDNRCKP